MKPKRQEQPRGEASASKNGAAENEEVLRAILETAVEGIITIDERGTVRSFNKAAERLFGWKSEEVIGRNVSMLMPPPYRDEHDQYLQNYMRTGQAKIIGIGREAVGQRKDGSRFPLQLGVNEAIVGERRIFTGFIQDLTERKRHESEAEEWRRELERRVELRTGELARANEELENFCHLISHDLRTPLRGIRNYVDFLREDLAGSLSGASTEDLRGLGRAADDLERMIQEMLEFSRIGRAEIPCEDIDLRELIEEIAKLAADRPGREVAIVGELPHLWAPYTMIRQIFQNLIENGLHYNKSELRRVEISCQPISSRPTKWRFAVKDNGIGIDPQFHHKIFAMFQRLHRPEDYEGSGIGLASVRKAARHLGGDVRVESAPGEGSTFLVDLPERVEEALDPNSK